MKFLVNGFLLFSMAALGLTFAEPSFAEGNCPPGQYPIGGQGVQGCAPIPGGGGGASSAPVPAGKWKKTWGAIAIDETSGNAGAAAGKSSKSGAAAEAIHKCEADGSTECDKNVFFFKNQCAALAVGDGGRYARSTGQNVEIASALAIEACNQKDCKVIYVECSRPVFVRY